MTITLDRNNPWPCGRFAAWMDENGLKFAAIRKLCSVSTETVMRWRSGAAVPSAKNLHTLERAGFAP